jgi:hypothetical protein
MEIKAPEIHQNLSFADYQAIDAINHSSLKNMAISAKYYLYKKQQINRPSPAMVLGTAIHAKLLEPDTFDDNVIVFEGKTKKGKAWDAFSELHSEKTIITQAQSDITIDASKNVMSNPRLKHIFTNPETQTELSLVWTDETTGLRCKCRIDALSGFLYDLKTTSSNTTQEFLKSAFKYYYHSQMAFYERGARACGLQCNGTKIVVAQTKDVLESYMVDVPFDTVDAGNKLIDGWLSELKTCIDEDIYRGLDTSDVSFELPEWAKDDEPLELKIGNNEVML